MSIAGRLVLNTILEAARIYAAAVLASSLIKIADKEWEQIKEEGFNRMRFFNAEDVDLVHLDPELVSYAPKDIHTEALQVTQENIGKLSLEFETAIKYDNSSGLPYLIVPVGRQTDDDPTAWAPLYLRLSDWVVPLWGEIHMFRDIVFRNTFTFDNPNVAAKHSQGPPQMPPILGNVRWGDHDTGIAAGPSVYPTRDADDVNLMDAARSSSKPELRALAEKLSKPLPRSVRHKSTGAYGVIESYGEDGKVWARMADGNDLLEFDSVELEDIN